MNKKFFSLKPKKEKELLKAAQPVVAVFSAIYKLKKEISEKERKIKLKNKRVVPGEVEKLKVELKKKKKELEKMGEKKVAEGKKATRFLLHYNQNLVKYISKGYSFFNKKIDYEEFIAEGMSSLLKAIEKFNLNSNNTFPTYGGYWIKQYFITFINKSQFINQGSGAKEKKNVVYYDNDYQNDDKESKSYSLLETLHDDENAEFTAEQARHRDAVIQINNLINALENRESVLLIRLISKVEPTNLLDIYYLATEEEREGLKKKMKLGGKTLPEVLQKYPLEEKKIHSLPLVKKYLSLFSKQHSFSEASKTLGKSENMTRKLKQESFKKLQKLAKERNLHLLIE